MEDRREPGTERRERRDKKHESERERNKIEGEWKR